MEAKPVINHLNNRTDLFKFTQDLHNKVNEKLNKKIFSYQEF